MRFFGKGLGGGSVRGRIARYERRVYDIPDTPADKNRSRADELDRFYNALKHTRKATRELIAKTESEIGSEESGIFKGYLLILGDPLFVDEAAGNIKSGMDAVKAVRTASDTLCEAFRDEDGYIAERASDIRAVAMRLTECMDDVSRGDITLLGDEPYILLAEDLAPDELMRLDRDKLLGLATIRGSAFSHTSILARAMDIPVVVGLGKDVYAKDGEEAVLNADEGILFISPDKGEEKAYFPVAAQNKKPSSYRLKDIGIRLYANVGSLRDTDIAAAKGADGIGLFRTEFLCLAQENILSENEQFEIYKSAAERMAGKPVVIRAFDIRDDKALKTDGDDIFTAQLRAILRASEFGDIKALFPMISSADEMRAVKARLKEAKSALWAEGTEYRDIALGVMIETPDAVLAADDIADEADFFSIGTNDLIQFLFGIDRHSIDLDEALDKHIKEVLSAIENVARIGHAHGIEVGICGELAADVKLVKSFIEMGVDALSVRANAIPDIRTHIGG